MTDKYAAECVGVFGGTFDPIHYGHLRMADELRRRLSLEEIRMMPARQPPHRAPPLASAEHRWQMLLLALREFPGLRADDREMRRAGPSYSIDSVEELQAELGSQVVIALCMGWDSLVSLPTWHRWADLLDRSAIIVVNRPHHRDAEATISEPLLKAIDDHPDPPLRRGGIYLVETAPYPMSATTLRKAVEDGREWPRDWVPASVLAYIKTHQLYGLR